jgi:polyferredoxin
MNEKMSKRRIQIKELQKLKMYEKEERRLLIRLHIFYLILLINLYTKNEN